MTNRAYELTYGFTSRYLKTQGFSEVPHVEGTILFTSSRDDLIVSIEKVPTVPTKARLTLALNAGGIIFDESRKPEIWGSTSARSFMSRLEELVKKNDAEVRLKSVVADSKIDELYRKIRLNYEVEVK